jgi:hypothetical protein
MRLQPLARDSLMDKTVYELDGQNFSDFAGFIQEFNRVLLAQFTSKWSWSLDAFSDYLKLAGHTVCTRLAAF